MGLAAGNLHAQSAVHCPPSDANADCSFGLVSRQEPRNLLGGASSFSTT